MNLLFLRRGRGWSSALAWVLSLSLAIQAIVLAIPTAPRDGYVALCAGGEIVYVAIGDIGLEFPSDHQPPAPEPCQWSLLGQAVLVPSYEAHGTPASHDLVEWPAPPQTVALGGAADTIRARAPPTQG
jgi:hypothetical protein